MKRKTLEIALDAIGYRIGDYKMLFANLDIIPTAETAARAGLDRAYEKMIELECAAVELKKEVLAQVQPDGWKHILSTFGGGVFLCPHCGGKSPERFPHCPRCGRPVKGGA